MSDMLVSFLSKIKNDHKDLCNKRLCDTGICPTHSSQNCEKIIKRRDSDLLSNDFVAIDKIYSSKGSPQVQKKKICDAVLIKAYDDKMLFVELSVLGQPKGKNLEDFTSGFLDKAKDTRSMIGRLSSEKYGLQFNSSEVQFELQPVCTKSPMPLSQGQESVDFLKFVSMMMMKSVNPEGIKILTPYSCE